MVKRLAGDGFYAAQGSQAHHDSLVSDMTKKLQRLDDVTGQNSNYYQRLADMEKVIDIMKRNPVEFHAFSAPITDVHGTPSGMTYSRYHDLAPSGAK